MQEDDILNLIHRYLSGVCTKEEHQVLKDWLEEDATHREYFKVIKNVWKVKPSNDIDVDFEEEWKKISLRLGIELDEYASPSTNKNPIRGSSPTNSQSSMLKYLLRVAAILLIIGIPAFYVVEYGSNTEPAESETQVRMQKIETAWGEKARMEFSDGSKIMLNAKSSVRFPQQFKGSKREIYLDGEAFFTIKHNKDVPFIVHSNGVAVKVLGTEFNVNSYKEDETIEVVVKDGKVAVQQNQIEENGESNLSAGDKEKHPSEVVLTRGQRTIVKAGNLPSRPEDLSLKPYLAWVNGRMVFEGAPLRNVIPKLKRAYNLNFEVQDSTILSERLKASFKRESPRKVLEIISFSLDIDYELHGDTVIFKLKTRKNQ